MEEHFATVWEAIADSFGDATAIVQGPRRTTWAQFEDRSARLAGAFQQAGLGPSSKVALFLYNAPEYLEGFFAALKIRAVPVNVNYRYLDDELQYLLVNADAEAIVCHAGLAGRVAAVSDKVPSLRLVLVVDDQGHPRPVGEGPAGGQPATKRYEDVLAATAPAPRIEREPDDIIMTFTGGTTGLPKGVMSRIGPGMRSLVASTPQLIGMPVPASCDDLIAGLHEYLTTNSQPVSLPACPLMHGTGLAIGALPALTFGGRIVLLSPQGFDPDELWETVEAEGVQYIVVVGDAFARPMLRALQATPGRQVDSVRAILSSGAMFSTEVKAGLLDRLTEAVIIDYIAATEGIMGLSIASREAPAATGRFFPGEGVTVLDEDGHPVEPGSGVRGLVAISGMIPVGYYGDDEKTAETFKIINGERYSVPGDWATIEADGQITLLGRGSQCINTGGEKVFPEEVEEILKTHPSIEDCLVFGVPDERFGQKVVAVASVLPGADARVDEVVDSARTRLSSYKLPRALVLVDTVPRHPNGKADYTGARDLFEAAATA